LAESDTVLDEGRFDDFSFRLGLNLSAVVRVEEHERAGRNYFHVGFP